MTDTRVVLGRAYRGLTSGFLLLRNFSVAISVSPLFFFFFFFKWAPPPLHPFLLFFSSPFFFFFFFSPFFFFFLSFFFFFFSPFFFFFSPFFFFFFILHEIPKFQNNIICRVVIPVSPLVCFILVLNLISMFLR